VARKVGARQSQEFGNIEITEKLPDGWESKSNRLSNPIPEMMDKQVKMIEKPFKMVDKPVKTMEKPFKVMECIRQGQIGGGETHMLSLIENMDRSRFEPVVLSFTDGPMVTRLREMGVKTHIIHTERLSISASDTGEGAAARGAGRGGACTWHRACSNVMWPLNPWAAGDLYGAWMVIPSRSVAAGASDQGDGEQYLTAGLRLIFRSPPAIARPEPVYPEIRFSGHQQRYRQE